MRVWVRIQQIPQQRGHDDGEGKRGRRDMWDERQVKMDLGERREEEGGREDG